MTGNEKRLLEMALGHARHAKMILLTLTQSPRDHELSDACAMLSADAGQMEEGIVTLLVARK